MKEILDDGYDLTFEIVNMIKNQFPDHKKRAIFLGALVAVMTEDMVEEFQGLV